MVGLVEGTVTDPIVPVQMATEVEFDSGYGGVKVPPSEVRKAPERFDEEGRVVEFGK
jgi:hypothetical protein